MYCCRPRSTKGRGASEHASAISLAEKNSQSQSKEQSRISPWSNYPPIDTRPLHRVPRGNEGNDSLRDRDSHPQFDARKVNEACREVFSTIGITPAMRSDAPGVLIPVKKQKDQIVKLPDTVKREIVALTDERPQWWKAQFSDNRHVQLQEQEERQRRRELSRILFAAEQERQVSEEVVNGIEEREDRKRRREFAKQALIEEQHVRVREQRENEAREAAIRVRRREWALRALRNEEVRRTTDRLMLREVTQGRAEKKGNNLRLWREREEQLREAERNKALVLYGLKLEVKCLEKEQEARQRRRDLRAQEDEDEDEGGSEDAKEEEVVVEERKEEEELGLVSRVILELHQRLCSDERDRRLSESKVQHRSTVAEVERRLRDENRQRLLARRQLCPSS